MKRLKVYWSEMDAGKKRLVKPLLGAVAGGILGYAYYALVGCSTGACPITSNPWISTFWGAMIGGFAST